MNFTIINLILLVVSLSVAIYFAVSDYRHQFTKRTTAAMKKLYDSDNYKLIVNASLKSLLYSVILFAIAIFFVIKLVLSSNVNAALNDPTITWCILLSILATLAEKSESEYLIDKANKEKSKKNN